jgi:Tol biopolymer transport system component
MSPEQAKGLSANGRSDVFAFGGVLYEMLTGRQAFQGETVSEILASVLVREPDFALLPPDLNPRLNDLLRRCLDKNPRRRWHCAGDLRMELESVASAARRKPDSVPPAPAQRRTRERLVWGLALLVVALIAAVAAFRLATPPPEMRVEITSPPTSDPISFAISPDGRYLLFVASGDGPPRLWLRSLDSTTAQPIAGTEGATYPFWSSDSRSAGFFANRQLKRVDIGGGLPQTLASVAGRGGTWGSEGIMLYADNVGALWRIPESGGAGVAATKLEAGQTNHRFPQFLPGGRQFLFFVSGSTDVRGIYLGSIDASETKRLTAADTAGLYAAPGWLLYGRQGSLVARHFDLVRGELAGDPVTIANEIGSDGNSAGAFSVSVAGLVAYRAGGASRRQLTWFDRSGKTLGSLGAPDESAVEHIELSPDGRRVAVNRTVQGNTDIWILDSVRSTRFTFDASADIGPVWSPDGSQIAFLSNRRGVNDIYQKPASGAGSEVLLFESQQDKFLNSWSANGQFLLFRSIDPKTSRDLWVLPLAGDRKPRIFLNTLFDELNSQFSPDGRWVAYQSNESGRNEIYVRPFPGPGGQWQVSTAGGENARWRHDGKELYYIAPDDRLMAVPIATQGATLEPGTPVAFFQTRIVGGFGGGIRQQYDVTSDGRFLINTATEDATTSPITLLLNWKPPAK